MTTNDHANDMMARMFLQVQAQFGDAIKSYWFNDSERCPGCARRIDFLKVKRQDAVSLNAFIYRERGVLIGYLLCSRCAKQIFQDAKRNPGQETARHEAIETSLIEAYYSYRNLLDA